MHLLFDHAWGSHLECVDRTCSSTHIYLLFTSGTVRYATYFRIVSRHLLIVGDDDHLEHTGLSEPRLPRARSTGTYDGQGIARQGYPHQPIEWDRDASTDHDSGR